MTEPCFSIVIPYYAQPETLDFIKRQLHYYNNHEVSCFVFLAVSGQKDSIKALQKMFADMDNPNFKILIHHDENIKNIATFISKIYEALKKVKTPYVALNGADDVLILETVAQCCKVLENEAEVSAVKGHTIYYNANTGKTYCGKDLPIIGNNVKDRIKYAIQDRDSIFYLVQRTQTLLEEFGIISKLYQGSQDLFEGNLFLPEHIRALNVASLGNVKVFDIPWRVQTSHDNNHSAHTPASFIRIQKGLLDRRNYQLFQDLNPLIKSLSYAMYKILSTLCQIRTAHTNCKQILFEFYHRRISLNSFIKIGTYFLLNKIFLFFSVRKKSNCYNFNKEYIRTKIYANLKKKYFSTTDIALIESFAENE